MFTDDFSSLLMDIPSGKSTEHTLLQVKSEKGMCRTLPRSYFVSKIKGSPSLPAPIMITFAFCDAAIFSVASMPFHRSS